LLRLRTDTGVTIIIDMLSQSVLSPIQLAEPEPSGCPWPRSETCRAKGNTMQVPSILQGESLAVDPRIRRLVSDIQAQVERFFAKARYSRHNIA
jgi:hypothetical protein